MRTMTGPVVERVRERLARRGGDITHAVLAQAVRAEAGGLLGDTDVLDALRALRVEFLGAGPLEELLAEPDLCDILVNGPDQVWADRGQGLVRCALSFPDEAAVRRLACRLALSAGRRLDEAQPFVDGRLPGFGHRGCDVRLHAVLPPLAARGTSIALRVLRPATQSLDELARRGSVPPAAAALVRRAVAERHSFLVTGSTGSGKTTLLSALLAQVSQHERIVLVEDSPELAPAHPHVVSLVARKPNVEGAGEVTVRELVRQSLRMRPDRVVVGEVRGAEVVDLLSALNTGHDGGAGTVHCNSPRELPARLEALAAMGGLDRAGLHGQLAASVRLVLHMRRTAPSGARTLVEIARLDFQAGVVVARELWSA
jgi:pilus assembly protein CpaF